MLRVEKNVILNVIVLVDRLFIDKDGVEVEGFVERSMELKII